MCDLLFCQSLGWGGLRHAENQRMKKEKMAKGDKENIA